MKPLSRRNFLKVGGLAVLGTAGATTLAQNQHQHTTVHPEEVHTSHAMQQGDRFAYKVKHITKPK